MRFDIGPRPLGEVLIGVGAMVVVAAGLLLTAALTFGPTLALSERHATRSGGVRSDLQFLLVGWLNLLPYITSLLLVLAIMRAVGRHRSQGST